MIWKFDKGVAKLQSMQESDTLPNIVVPQPGADDVPILRNEVHEASETLGVYTNA